MLNLWKCLQLLAGQHLISFLILGDGLVDDVLRQVVITVGVGQQPVADELLIKGGLTVAGLVASSGQKREESGVSISSPRMTLPSSSRPNSNLVSAMMMPRERAYSAHFLYRAMV